MLVSASVTGKEIYDVRNTIDWHLYNNIIISTCLISFAHPAEKIQRDFSLHHF
jgi:hypothetical protein